MLGPRVGVLALQGDFACHLAALEALGVQGLPVRRTRDFDGLEALILPGGESTTMLTLIESQGLRAALEDGVRRLPVLGTCAGLILLGRGASRLPGATLNVLDVEVERNAYGRQIDSFSAEVDAPAVGGRFPAVFIRAPRLGRLGAGLEVVARRIPGAGIAAEPVGVREGRRVGLCFHPELTRDLRFHRWFLAEVAGLDLPSAAGATSGAAEGA
jgi:5'-phosphate synthase pdxT subunit